MMNFNKQEIYTPLHEAYGELLRRRSDLGLLRSVLDFLADSLPSGIESQPRLVLCRSIVTPNYELQYFLSSTNRLPLRPLVYEYHDAFVAINPMKYHLCKLFFYQHSRKGKFFLKNTLRIINFNTEEGKSFNLIKTLQEESLIDFHHNFLKLSLPRQDFDIQNFTDWFNAARQPSENYYAKFLALFITHGILIEDYLFEDRRESEMINQRLIPSFLAIHKTFGLKPLICRLLPSDSAANPIWYSYPSSYVHSSLFLKYKK